MAPTFFINTDNLGDKHESEPESVNWEAQIGSGIYCKILLSFLAHFPLIFQYCYSLKSCWLEYHFFCFMNTSTIALLII